MASKAQVANELAKQGGRIDPKGASAETGRAALAPDSVPAGGMSNAQAAGAAAGQALVDFIGKNDQSLYEHLNSIIVRNEVDYWTGFYGAVVSTRDIERKAIKDAAATEIEAIKGTDLTPAARRKSIKVIENREQATLANLSVKYSKVIKVLQTIGQRWGSKPKVVDFSQCRTFTEMLTASRLSDGDAKKKRGPAAMTKAGFDAWLVNTGRIIDLADYVEDGEGADEKDVKRSLLQREHLERAMERMVLTYLKASEEIGTLRPISSMIPVKVKAEAGHIREATTGAVVQ